ncbi:hypothetical protein M5K25_008994 [Dendrobium thyrsiflorum]|uniref:Uncharacterized protein n=1 Tax=Dendrobium thyrsiflorum TaxID=117978 RepID=A0ABD0VA69_DENTH
MRCQTSKLLDVIKDDKVHDEIGQCGRCPRSQLTSAEGRTDILRSPFFDVYFSQDDVTADDYLDRILYQLTLSIEEHIRSSQWVILRRRPPPPTTVTFSPTKVFGLLFLVVVSCLPSHEIEGNYRGFRGVFVTPREMIDRKDRAGSDSEKLSLII